MTWSQKFSGTSEELEQQITQSNMPQPAKSFVAETLRAGNDEWNLTVNGSQSDHGNQWGANVNAVFTLIP